MDGGTHIQLPRPRQPYPAETTRRPARRAMIGFLVLLLVQLAVLAVLSHFGVRPWQAAALAALSP